jgi:hypothetical protein
MAKISAIFRKLILAALLVTATQAQEPAPDFRKAVWGMSPSEVKTGEAQKPVLEKDQGLKRIVAYSDHIIGLECAVYYIFVQNQLIRAKYLILEDHSNKSEYLLDFTALEKALTEKYGKPTKQETLWKNDLFRTEPQQWGLAVSAGHLMKYSSWETARTVISIIIKGDNYEVSLGVEYSGKILSELEESADKKEQEGKL